MECASSASVSSDLKALYKSVIIIISVLIKNNHVTLVKQRLPFCAEAWHNA